MINNHDNIFGPDVKLSDIKVSLTSNFYDKQPISSVFSKIMETVNGDALKATTASIRRLRKVAEDESLPTPTRLRANAEADKQKKLTPMVYIHACFSNGKKKKDIDHYNPFLAYDADHLSEVRVREVMDIMRKDPHIVFAQPSCSGRGIHGVLYTDTADFLNAHWDGTHTDAYTLVWSKMKEYVEALIGEPIDESCKNVERGLALCYDEQTFFNPDAAPLHIDTSDFQPRDTRGKKAKATSARSGKKKTKQVALDKVKDQVIDELSRQGCSFEEGRNNYVYRFAAICNTYGVEEQEVIDYSISTYEEDDFPASEITATVRSAYTQEQNHGSRQERMRYISPEELKEYIDSYGKWRYNEITLEYEVQPEGESGFRTCMDEDANEIYRQALFDNRLTSVKQIETIIHSLQTEHYHPVKDFRDSLPACRLLPDGRCLVEGRPEPHDYIAELADRLHTTSPVEEVRHYFKIWFVQMVKSWINADQINQYIFGLLGKQGIFKTTFFEKLLPPVLVREYFDIKETNGQFGKDEMMKLSRLMLYLLEEVDEMSPKELNQLKAIATMKMVKIRLPYGRNIKEIPRIASLALTGNKREILNDSTGNRRYFPFWVESIDSPHDNPIDYDALYAQAFKLAEPESGFISYVPVEEVEALNRRNLQFSIPILEHELVDHYLGKPDRHDSGVFESGGIVTQYLQQFAYRQTLDVRKVTSYLRELGYEEKRSSKNKLFHVVHLRADQILDRSRLETHSHDDFSHMDILDDFSHIDILDVNDPI